jgi:hypothetical protein
MVFILLLVPYNRITLITSTWHMIPIITSTL